MVTKIRAVDDIFRRVTKSWPKNSDGFLRNLALGFADRGISEGSLSFLKNIEENIKFLKGFQNSDQFPRGKFPRGMLLRGVKLEDVVDRGV
jgi:hypothetical protein